MENQRRLANKTNRYEAGHSGVPRKGAALLQGIAVCGRCGRRMSLRYSGPAGDYPVYTCRADRDQEGGRYARKCVRCPSMRTSKASCSRPCGRTRSSSPSPSWARSKRRRVSLSGIGRCGASGRAMRQNVHGANMMRSILRTVWWRVRWSAWEEKLRAAEAIEQDYERWRSDEPLVLSEPDREALQKLGEDPPGIWHAPSRTAAERCIICEVALDQKRLKGQVWFKILWQTGATSDHSPKAGPHLWRLHRCGAAAEPCDRT